MNITEKYYWITQHPKYVPFADTAVIEITPHMVCPETNCIENLGLLNTKLRFWVELMIPHFDEQNKQHCHAHDYELDCGGDTWEEAVENLYQLVLEKYGDYTDEDMAKHSEEALKEFDFDSWLNKQEEFMADSEPNTDEIVMLPDYEIEHMKHELVHMEKVLEVLYTKLVHSLTPQEYDDIQLEITCIDHDILVYKECIRLGYDVEKYGYRDEDRKIDKHSA